MGVGSMIIAALVGLTIAGVIMVLINE
jgi:hypothetical protein